MKKYHYLFAFAFFLALGLSIMAFSLIFRLADRFFFNPGQIGIFIALGQVFYFIGLFLYYRFGSVFNPIKVFSVSSVIIFLATIPLIFTRTYIILYVSFFLIQVNIGLFWPPVMAWLSSGLERQELNRGLGFYNRSWMAGQLLGPLFAGILYPWNSNFTFFVVSFACFLAIPIIFLMKRKIKNSPGNLHTVDPSEGEIQEAVLLDEQRSKSFSLFRYRGWISGLSALLFLGVLANVVPLHIRDGLGHTELSAGILLFLRCIASFLGFIIFARFTAWNFSRRWFLVLQCGLLFCTLALMFFGNNLFFYFFIVLLYGLIFAACYNNSIFYSGATGGNNKKNFAIQEIYLCAGNAAGTAGGGLFYQMFGFLGVCIALFLVLSLSSIVLVALNRADYRLAPCVGQ